MLAGENPNVNLEGAPLIEAVLYQVKKVIVGQDHLVERLLVALLARGGPYRLAAPRAGPNSRFGEGFRTPARLRR